MLRIFICTAAMLFLLLGCASYYCGIIWVRYDAVSSYDAQRNLAVALRDVVLQVANDFGLDARVVETHMPRSVFPDLLFTAPRSGLKEPYNRLGGAAEVSLSVSFVYPYSIFVAGGGGYEETEVIKVLRSRLESEIATIDSAVSVSFRRDYFQLN